MEQPYLSVIIPAYNEARRIGGTLESIREYLATVPYTAEVLVIVNNTIDNTEEVLQSYKESMPYLHMHNIGVEHHDSGTKGKAVQYGVLQAKGQYVLYMDADNATELKEVETFWKYFESGYEVVFGSRYVKGAKTHRVWYRNILGKASNMLVQAVLLPRIWDTQCGFKCFTAKAAQDIFSRVTIKGWGFDLEVLALARKFKYKSKEVPIHWHEIGHSSVKAGAFISTLRELLIIRRKMEKVS